MDHVDLHTWYTCLLTYLVYLCGEYGLVLCASWLSTEPPNEDVGPQ